MAGTTTYYGISYPTSTDYVKDGATAMQTIADGFDSAVAIPTYNNQTGTSYTFVLADAGKTVTSNNASAVTFTIPPQASVAWANNTTLTVRNLGAGVVTIAGGAGVTVTNTAQTVAQYGEVKLIRTASNAWTVVPASGGTSGLTLIKAQTVGTGVSSVTVSDVFSSTYDNYKIMYTDGTNTGQFKMQLTSITSGYAYNDPYILWNGSWVARGNSSSSTFSVGDIYVNYELLNPNLAKFKSGFSVGNDSSAMVLMTMYNASTVQSTGFTLSATSMTGGTIRVYGYQK